MSGSLTYRDSGVDIDAGNKLVDKLKNIVPRTHREGVLGSLGGFGGCFEIPVHRYNQPVLVSSTDGVGTKLRLAIDLQQHDTIGIDLVAMCVNDLVVMGAEPLFFLDYFATGQLDVDIAARIISGIATGCQMANVALLGGETAEMPGMYAAKDYDLAGFTVGIVNKPDIITGDKIIPGDVLLALASSGPHANGYSLIRHLLNMQQVDLSTPFDGSTLGNVLLTPTRLYVKSLLSLIEAKMLKGAAHITGGGFIDNIPRVLPSHCAARIDLRSWTLPSIFEWLQTQGQIKDHELYRTFNCGVGMIACVSPANVDHALAQLHAHGETAWIVGQIIPRQHDAVVFSNA